jgi:hypothetical protein
LVEELDAITGEQMIAVAGDLPGGYRESLGSRQPLS